MNKSPQVRQTIGKIFIPHKSLTVCFGIALLAPYVGSMPDIPFGHWRLITEDSAGKFHIVDFIVGSLFVFLSSLPTYVQSALGTAVFIGR